MFAQITAWILEAIKSHGMLAVILGVVIETIIVPLPSPLIIMTAGYLLIPKGTMIEIMWAALWISIVAGIAQTIGSYMLYYIGYYGGKPVIDRTEKILGVSWKEITLFQKKFAKKGKEELTIFIMRLLPIMPLSVVSGVAGVIKMDFRKYTISTLMGVIPRNFMLALCGFFFSGFYEIIATRIDNAETIMTGLILIIIIAYFVAKKTGMIDALRKKVFT
ncbi:MAG: VTT domain-containing protein [archaeon]